MEEYLNEAENRKILQATRGIRGVLSMSVFVIEAANSTMQSVSLLGQDDDLASIVDRAKDAHEDKDQFSAS